MKADVTDKPTASSIDDLGLLFKLEQEEAARLASAASEAQAAARTKIEQVQETARVLGQRAAGIIGGDSQAAYHFLVGFLGRNVDEKNPWGPDRRRDALIECAKDRARGGERQEIEAAEDAEAA